MSSIRNTVQLIGNLGATPEVRTTSNGRKVAKVSIATNRTYTNKDGEKVRETQWHRLVGWDKTAEYMESYLDKGSYIGVLGRLTHRTLKSDDGTSRTYTEINVSEIKNFSRQELPI